MESSTAFVAAKRKKDPMPELEDFTQTTKPYYGPAEPASAAPTEDVSLRTLMQKKEDSTVRLAVTDFFCKITIASKQLTHGTSARTSKKLCRCRGSYH